MKINRHRLILALMPPLLGVSITIGAVLAVAHDTTNPDLPTATQSAPAATPAPSPSHRPGVYPWESCSAHPNPSCPKPATTGCPKSVAPGLEPFYRHCF